MTGDRLGNVDTATLLRRGVLLLAVLGIVGAAVELVFLRHWKTATQLIVWPTIVALAVSLVFLVQRPTRRAVVWARRLAVGVAVVAVIGVVLHANANFDAGPLDRAFATRWDTMSPIAQWWEALTGGVGPAPVLAPGVLAEISLALLIATLRHPALEGGNQAATA